MKILIINGSPKGIGNTQKISEKVQAKLKTSHSGIEFENIILKDLNLQFCSGCYLCLSKGENYCPLKDDRIILEEKMSKSDGLIFASPVYVYNMSFLSKNFVDRFAYVCHRPQFHTKKAMVISTTGAVRLKFVTIFIGIPTYDLGI